MASFHDRTAAAMLLLLFSLLSGVLPPPPPRVVHAQQPYGTEIADCTNTHNASGLLGYFCGDAGSNAPPSCPTFLTFTARPPRSTLASIAALLAADPSTLLAPPPPNAGAAADLNAPLPAGTRVLVPATCACTATAAGRFYQGNTTTTAYVAVAGDTPLIIANETFQGLTTCQAVQAQALRGAPPESLATGQRLAPLPLRCACPTAAQAAAGASFLVTYLVDPGDDLAAVAARFGADLAAVADANRLLPPSFTIFPFTSLLIPVAAPPNVSRIQTPPPPPPPPPPPVLAPPAPAGKKIGVYIAVAAVAVLAVAAIATAGAFLALRTRRRRRAGAVLAAAGEVVVVVAAAEKKKAGKGDAFTSSGFPFTLTGTGALAGCEFSSSVSTSEAWSSISVTTEMRATLKVYTYAELRAATENFSERRRVGGSVYRAAFEEFAAGETAAAAVEVVDRDVAAEVELMRRINHLNLIRLVGLCHHRGRWYLVTEFAEHGALRDRLLSPAAPPLTWPQRVQVALDVAEGLRYLHEFARPPWVHMDVNSGTVLLAAGDVGAPLRAKLRGFGAARSITGATTAGAGGDGEAAMFTMTSRIAGTRGYMAPEYVEHGVVSPKADVYALVVSPKADVEHGVLLELVSGRDADELLGGGDGDGDPFVALRELAEELEHGGDGGRRRLEELVDPALLPAGRCSCPWEAVGVVVRLAERCVRREPARRPTAGEVAQELLKLSGVSVLTWQRSRSSPSPPESPRSSGSGTGLMY